MIGDEHAGTCSYPLYLDLYVDQKGCTFSEGSRNIGEVRISRGSVASFGCGLHRTFSWLCICIHVGTHTRYSIGQERVFSRVSCWEGISIYSERRASDGAKKHTFLCESDGHVRVH